MSEELKPAQSKTTMIIVCLFLGGIGIHRMMMGYQDWWKRLIIAFLCAPVSGIMSLIDLFKIIGGS